jgi:hypothetical protein
VAVGVGVLVDVGVADGAGVAQLICRLSLSPALAWLK